MELLQSTKIRCLDFSFSEKNKRQSGKIKFLLFFPVSCFLDLPETRITEKCSAFARVSFPETPRFALLRRFFAHYTKFCLNSEGFPRTHVAWGDNKHTYAYQIPAHLSSFLARFRPKPSSNELRWVLHPWSLLRRAFRTNLNYA